MTAATITPTRPRGGTPPARSLAQRREALERANAVRSARKRMNRDLAAGRMSIAAALAHPAYANADVFDVLRALPKIGRVKAEVEMRRVRISLTKKCAGLTDRQRDELLVSLRARGIR